MDNYAKAASPYGAGIGATMAQQQLQAQETRDANASEALLSRLNGIRELLSNLIDREQRIVTRAFGPEPSAQVNGAEPEPTGMLGLLAQRADQIEQLANAAHHVLSRIDTII